METLAKELGFKVQIAVATVYYKPTKNKLLPIVPDYYLHTSDKWLCFPHELEGMSWEEIEESMGEDVLDVVLDVFEKKIRE